MSQHKFSSSPEQAAVLTKALLNLADQYALRGKDLSEILGISEASATRLNQKQRLIEPNSKEGELALLLLRLYRSLNALLGNDSQKAVLWLNSTNQYFAGERPIDLIKTVSGLINVINYCDAMRGKL